MKHRPLRLGVVELERRDVPATVYPSATFDDRPNQLPTTWTNYATGGAAVQVTTNQGRNNSNALTISGSSVATARAWDTRLSGKNVEVRASILVNSLIPAQVIARGKSLNTETPSYYAAGITRGGEIQLVKVVNGVSTVIDTVTTKQYFSNQWVDLALTVQDNRLQVRVQRIDTGEWLNQFGVWQGTPTQAIFATDSQLPTAGQVGVNRPKSYFGSVILDNFRSWEAKNDITPPTVSILFPTLPKNAPQTGVQGIVKIYTDIKDQGKIARADFLVDGDVVSRRDVGPFRMDLDTRNFANGQHTLTVRVWDAAGNSTETDLSIKFANAPKPTPPSVKRHFPHIRYASLAYYGTPMDETTQRLLKDSVDLVIPNQRYLSTINQLTPETPQYIYSNISNLYLGLLTSWLNEADAKAVPREGAFYHVSEPTPFTGDSPSSRPVNRFWNVQRGSAKLTSLTSEAMKLAGMQQQLGNSGESLIVGYPDRFREVNVTISKAAGRNFNGVWEYPIQVDSLGRPIRWQTLPLTSDRVRQFRTTGQITFDPPANWKPSVIGDQTARLFHIRYRTISGDRTNVPTISQITGRDYVNANGKTTGVIPAFDRAADRNQDGYLSDAEYAKRRSGMDARFYYESRLFYPYYGQMRFITNPSGTGFANWAAQYHQQLLASQPLADGIMMDNSGGKLPNLQAKIVEQTDSYTYDSAAVLAQISRTISPKQIVANTAGGGTTATKIDDQVAGSLEEFALRPMQQQWAQVRTLATEINQRLDQLDAGQFLILDTLSSGGGSPTDPRTRIAALAYYYLVADPDATYLMTWGGEEPASDWNRHWFGAISYNVGQPQGTWQTAATGNDPVDTRLAYQVFARRYDQGLVLYKPRSYTAGVGTGTLNDNTATTHQLDGNYRQLDSEGNLGPVIQTITLRNGEGAILIRA